MAVFSINAVFMDIIGNTKEIIHKNFLSHMVLLLVISTRPSQRMSDPVGPNTLLSICGTILALFPRQCFTPMAPIPGDGIRYNSLIDKKKRKRKKMLKMSYEYEI